MQLKAIGAKRTRILQILNFWTLVAAWDTAYKISLATELLTPHPQQPLQAAPTVCFRVNDQLNEVEKGRKRDFFPNPHLCGLPRLPKRRA